MTNTKLHPKYNTNTTPPFTRHPKTTGGHGLGEGEEASKIEVALNSPE